MSFKYSLIITAISGLFILAAAYLSTYKYSSNNLIIDDVLTNAPFLNTTELDIRLTNHGENTQHISKIVLKVVNIEKARSQNKGFTEVTTVGSLDISSLKSVGDIIEVDTSNTIKKGETERILLSLYNKPKSSIQGNYKYLLNVEFNNKNKLVEIDVPFFMVRWN